MTVLQVLDHVSLMNPGVCGKSCRTFLKNTQNQAACRTVDKTGDIHSFNAVAYCTDAGDG